MSLIHHTREQWLTAAVDALRPQFDLIGKPLPLAIRVTCGFPLHARRSKAIGQCWASTASADKTIEIMISPVLAQPLAVLEVLVHELCHATDGAMNHGLAFQKTALDMALMACGTGKQAWKSTKGNPLFGPRNSVILAGLGDYAHAELVPGSETKTQPTRMLKLCCPSCGYTVRTTAKWVAAGLPTCPCGDTLIV
jgi:Protein of unknown function DUF45